MTCYQRGFIAQLVEHCTGIMEVMGSNFIGASAFFLGFICNCLSYFTTAKISYTSTFPSCNASLILFRLKRKMKMRGKVMMMMMMMMMMERRKRKRRRRRRRKMRRRRRKMNQN